VRHAPQSHPLIEKEKKDIAALASRDGVVYIYCNGSSNHLLYSPSLGSRVEEQRKPSRSSFSPRHCHGSSPISTLRPRLRCCWPPLLPTHSISIVRSLPGGFGGSNDSFFQWLVTIFPFPKLHLLIFFSSIIVFLRAVRPCSSLP
jgi:hypothetical protein